MKRLWAALALVLAGCGRYADFTLPHLTGRDPHASFEWNARPTPVLEPESGAADSHDALNPSIVRHSGLLNLYSAFDGRTWVTAAATSTDGLSWNKLGPVLAPRADTWEGSYIAANGSLLWSEGAFWYWYQAGPRGAPQLGLARSTDARTWHRENAPVLPHGPYASWDERAVADPYVLRTDPYFYLYYLGQDRRRAPAFGRGPFARWHPLGETAGKSHFGSWRRGRFR